MILSTPTDREMEVMRLIHAGCALVSKGTKAGHIELRGAETVRPSSIDQMVKAGWLVFNDVLHSWHLTEAGHEMVRTRDDVARFIKEAAC